MLSPFMLCCPLSFQYLPSTLFLIKSVCTSDLYPPSSCVITSNVVQLNLHKTHAMTSTTSTKQIPNFPLPEKRAPKAIQAHCVEYCGQVISSQLPNLMIFVIHILISVLIIYLYIYIFPIPDTKKYSIVLC